ncbi:MAG: HEAT repeat domain-containing protein [Oryzomonas sp.]|uniref:HEAT repeat domain-containing protein n=1 Tax=Oryzomonas sp. TaxID=2855186 RepID=UPI002850C836|nr:HEAT repeat domain-containing protein [Oryzomonas sp.]MDR3581048.1 HEAT repeat domain-containing protein [Oryzomonas sp.]
MDSRDDVRNALKSPDEELRRTVIDSLRGENLGDVCEFIFTAMGDDSWRVRKEAVNVFVAAEPSGDFIAALLELLRDESNAGLRNSAAEAVIMLGTQAARQLKTLAGDTDPGVRKFVVDVMGGIGSTEFVPALLGALHDADANVSAAAAEHLGTIGDAGVVQELLTSITSNDSVFFRFSALSALEKLGIPAPLPEEIKRLVGQEIFSKVIFDCLGSIGNHTAAPILLEGFLSSQKSSRCAAVKAFNRVLQRSDGSTRLELEGSLRRLSGSDVVPAFIELLDAEGPDSALAEALTNLLGIIGDARAAVPLLATYLTERLSSQALNALIALGPAGMDAVRGFYPHADEKLCEAICTLFGEVGYQKGDDVIREALHNPSPSVREAAVQAAGLRGLSDCIPEIIGLLDDADDSVSGAIIAALQVLSGKDPNPVNAVARQLAESDRPQRRRDAALLFAALSDGDYLGRLVKDEDPSVRQASVAAIGKLQIPSLQGILQIALVDEMPEVRMMAAEALGESGSADAVGPLTLALRDDDSRVQCAALKSITRLNPENSLDAIRDLLPTVGGLLMITCLEVLASLGSDAALSLVETVLDNEDEELVKLAFSILSCHDGQRIVRNAERLISHPHAGIRYDAAMALAALPGQRPRTILQDALETEESSHVRNLMERLVKGTA